MAQPHIFITKASGERALFSPEKLHASLLRSGAGADVASEIVKDISSRIHEGISTKKIYRWAFSLLRERSDKLAGRYHLKKAIMELGPEGFAFEKFVAAILEDDGYQVKVGQIVKGKCVDHEIDVIAEKGKHHFMVECKFHNQPGTVSDVKVPLYIQARFKDVEAEWKQIPGHGTKFHQGWVVTNTRFTSDAIKYGTCVGLRLIGWDHPNGGSLRHRIDDSGLYPVTCLNTLTRIEKKALLKADILLSRDLCSNPKILSTIGVKSHRVQKILDESALLCHLGKPAHGK